MELSAAVTGIGIVLFSRKLLGDHQRPCQAQEDPNPTAVGSGVSVGILGMILGRFGIF